MRDDIRKTKTIFLTMVEEKLLLHGGVNGLFQTLIINYEITGAVCLEAVIFSIFYPGCDQCLILCCFSRADESPATKSKAQIINK